MREELDRPGTRLIAVVFFWRAWTRATSSNPSCSLVESACTGYPLSIVVPKGYRLALTVAGKDWQFAPNEQTVTSKDYEEPNVRTQDFSMQSIPIATQLSQWDEHHRYRCGACFNWQWALWGMHILGAPLKQG
jgi:hypothetical protein